MDESCLGRATREGVSAEVACELGLRDWMDGTRWMQWE